MDHGGLPRYDDTKFSTKFSIDTRVQLRAVARARSPGGIFEEFLKILKNKIGKKVSKFFGDTVSRIVIDHKNDHPPPPAPRTLKLNTSGVHVADLTFTKV
jgi:hypothetical protein